ncbi:unnamed protein product [Acanthoscelides obtectus]|uniref:Uncharacterized protein n=1 Tax=Acanthoscelides obtectus TaxID=200917 RepID=A0A9P0K4P8_ACAOB|nr:unnamed protein product [Acanthoscelides obtectus]CAK1634198.1 hypothetical protein AOBTE_LOCUS8656 [Acanthoscelides obtectus]
MSKRPPKSRSSKFNRNFWNLFCCLKLKSEADEACQVDECSLTSLNEENSNEELNRIQVELTAKPQLNVNILHQNSELPLAEEFKTSLGKLDSLIDTLNSLKVYKPESEKEPEPDIVLKEEQSKEGLKFNVALNNVCIKCKIRRDKHTLSIVNNRDSLYQTHGFAKCDAELMVHQDDFPKDPEEFKENKEDLLGGQLLRANGQHKTRNFGMFSKICKHLRLIKNGVIARKRILCIVERDDKYRFSFRFGDLRSWFASDCDLKKEKVLVKTESVMFMEAKIRAINFCKFHRLLKVTKTKKKKAKISL